MGDKTSAKSGDRGAVMVLAICCIAFSLGAYKGISWLAGRSAAAELCLLAAEPGRDDDRIEALSASIDRGRDLSAWAAAGLGLAAFAVTAGVHVSRSRAGAGPTGGGSD